MSSLYQETLAQGLEEQQKKVLIDREDRELVVAQDVVTPFSYELIYPYISYKRQFQIQQFVEDEELALKYEIEGTRQLKITRARLQGVEPEEFDISEVYWENVPDFHPDLYVHYAISKKPVNYQRMPAEFLEYQN